jgi:hypothetical protein
MVIPVSPVVSFLVFTGAVIVFACAISATLCVVFRRHLPHGETLRKLVVSNLK